MDYLAQLMSDQLMAERRDEAARHNLAQKARRPQLGTARLPRLVGLLRLAGQARPVARPSRAEGTP